MTDTPYITYAIWGSGDITQENALALLGEYAPDMEEVGTIYRPERTTRDEKGLRTVLDLLESHPDVTDAGGLTPSTDLLQSLTFDRDTQGDDVFLLVLWPNEPGHADFDFIEAAQKEGIPVIDLAHAWTELDLSLYSRPEPTREEKAAARAEAKATKTRTPRKLSDAAPEEDGTVTVAVTEPEVPIQENAQAMVVPDEAIEAMLGYNMSEAIKEYIRFQVRKAMEEMILSAKTTAPVLPEDDRPPFDGPYVGVDTKEYYWNQKYGDAASWRVASGKPRRGEKVMNLTDEEAREKGLL